jgi:hypothetical protein
VSAAPGITAATVKHSFLEPGLDVVASVLREYDPSPDLDSLLEMQRALLRRLPPGPERELHLRLNRRLIFLNVIERRQGRRIVGDADQLARDLRWAELNDSGHRALGAKAIARRLRPALHLLARPAGVPAPRLVEAARVVGQVVALVPAAQLLAPAVRHELGERKFAFLRDQVERAHKTGAAEVRHSRRPAL